MTGRWRQSSIGIIVSILPAAIYLAAAFTVAGTGGPVSIGTLVAFTALQAQLFRPMVSLLRTGVDMQTSMAMFRRVFDYLDQPVDIDDPDHAPDAARRSAASCDSRASRSATRTPTSAR